MSPCPMQMPIESLKILVPRESDREAWDPQAANTHDSDKLTNLWPF